MHRIVLAEMGFKLSQRPPQRPAVTPPPIRGSTPGAGEPFPSAWRVHRKERSQGLASGWRRRQGRHGERRNALCRKGRSRRRRLLSPPHQDAWHVTTLEMERRYTRHSRPTRSTCRPRSPSAGAIS